jgi:hypothetical protein
MATESHETGLLDTGLERLLTVVLVTRPTGIPPAS